MLIFQGELINSKWSKDLRLWKYLPLGVQGNYQLPPFTLPASQGMTWAQKITHVYNDKAAEWGFGEDRSEVLKQVS